MQFRFAIDNHILQVVEADFVPVKQFNVTFITVGIGSSLSLYRSRR
jgi:hypothetical protein